MNLLELARLGDLSGWTSQQNLPVRMKIQTRQGSLDGMLAAQAIDIREGLNVGIDGHAVCVSQKHDLPLKAFEGVPATIEIVTARGTLRRIPAMIRKATRGQSDGALTIYQFHLVDPLALLRKRITSRVFRNKSVVEVSDIVLNELRRSAPRLGYAFDFVTQLDRHRYPKREFTMQFNESVTAFLVRIWKRAGINYFFRPATNDDAPPIELVLFDDSLHLERNAVAGALRYHRQDGTEREDSILLWAESRQVVQGDARHFSHDYKADRVSEAAAFLPADQGEDVDDLAAFLQDVRIESPHAADDYNDFMRQTNLHMSRQAYEHGCMHGISGVRDMAVGEYHEIGGHGLLDLGSTEDREYVITSIHHRAENNRKDIGERVAKLMQLSERLPGWNCIEPLKNDDDPDARHRYLNGFTAIKRGEPIAPHFDAATDWPVMRRMRVLLVGPEGEPVHTDQLGRVKVQFLGLRPEEHEHAQGAGTNGNHEDSAWIQVDLPWAGNGMGFLFPPRAGMIGVCDFEMGDPDRPVLVAMHYSGHNWPPRLHSTDGIPKTSRQSGIQSQEIQGSGYSQLVFDDTTGEVSIVLHTQHGHSRLMLGELRGRRTDGHGAALGEGFYLQTDESGAIRTAKSLLITAYGRLDSQGVQLDAQEHQLLVEDCYQLFTRLGQYAAEHQGLALDDKPQAQLKADLKAAQGGSNTDSQGQGGAPTISITAPAGIATTTPKTILHYAGVNIDSVAQQHYNQVAGQQYNLNAGQGIGLFSHHNGIKAIAHHGPFVMQSQHDDIEANAANNIKWTATNGQLVGMAKKIVLMAEDGSFIQIGGGITLGTSGVIAQKAAEFTLGEPATMAAELPTFGSGTPEKMFVLRHGGAQSPVAALRSYRAKLGDGSIVEGVTDAQGNTQILQRDAMHMIDIQFIDKPKA